MALSSLFAPRKVSAALAKIDFGFVPATVLLFAERKETIFRNGVIGAFGRVIEMANGFQAGEIRYSSTRAEVAGVD